MKNPVERLLYITLVVIFITVGLVLYFLTKVLYVQNQQLKKIEALNQTQDHTLQEIKAAQTEIELNDQRNAKIIICMLQVPVAQRTPDLEQNCRAQVISAVSQVSQPAPTKSTPPAPSLSPTSPASPAPSPQPSPQPSSTQQILNFVRGLL